jgi:hypothetical protein
LKKFKRTELLEITEPSKEKSINGEEQDQDQDQDQEEGGRGLAYTYVVSQRLIRRAIATC